MSIFPYTQKSHYYYSMLNSIIKNLPLQRWNAVLLKQNDSHKSVTFGMVFYIPYL